MEIFALWFVFSVVVGVIAGSKGRSGFGYFLLSLLLSPLLIGILVLALGRPQSALERVSTDTHVRCPDCREVVRKDASKCKHCGSALTPQW